MAKNRYTRDAVLEAIHGSGGIVSNIARRLGCDWHTAKTYVEQWTQTASAFMAEKETIKDLSENQLVEAIRAGDPWAIKFHLTTQAKDRGYSERREITGADGEALEVEYTLVDPDE